MNDWALSWLRAMKPPAPPTEPVRTPRIETPAHLRHTVPPVSPGPMDLPRNESLADLQSYEFRCAGMCPGGMCPRCDALADEIGWARLFPADLRDAREADLTQQITALKEGRC